MEVPGLCQACHRPGVLDTCPLCGALVHPECRASGLHAHGGTSEPKVRKDWGEPRF